MLGIKGRHNENVKIHKSQQSLGYTCTAVQDTEETIAGFSIYQNQISDPNSVNVIANESINVDFNEQI